MDNNISRESEEKVRFALTIIKEVLEKKGYKPTRIINTSTPNKTKLKVETEIICKKQ